MTRARLEQGEDDQLCAALFQLASRMRFRIDVSDMLLRSYHGAERAGGRFMTALDTTAWWWWLHRSPRRFGITASQFQRRAVGCGMEAAHRIHARRLCMPLQSVHLILI